ncbi:hypothetical protein ACHQM5_021874 [Ranunculus cassubicifolius]
MARNLVVGGEAAIDAQRDQDESLHCSIGYKKEALDSMGYVLRRLFIPKYKLGIESSYPPIAVEGVMRLVTAKSCREHRIE